MIKPFSNKFRLLTCGTLFVFLLTACGEGYYVPAPSVQQQPPPQGPPHLDPGDQDGGSNITTLIGGVVGALVVGFLIKRWLRSSQQEKEQEKEKKETVPGEVLVVIPLAPIEQMTALGEELSASHAIQLQAVYPLLSGKIGILVFGVLGKTGEQTKAAELGLDPRVLWAQPNLTYKTTAHTKASGTSLSYGLQMIHADHVSPMSNGKGVTIGLVDTGVDRNHIALKGQIIETLDFTGEGFSPDLHGTLLAGVMAAHPTKELEISGVAPQARLIAIKSCRPIHPNRIEALCQSVSVARGIDAALFKGAQVINLSVGGPKDRLVTHLVDEAARQGRIVVAAAGNDGPKGPTLYPAGLDNLIAVTAVDIQASLYPEATRGDFIDIAAPGVEILSAAPGNQAQFASGTSLSAAYVSATAALLLQHRPTLSFSEIKAILEETAKDLGLPGKESSYGSGLLDVCRAVATALPSGGRQEC